jgi:hypothetical protein
MGANYIIYLNIRNNITCEIVLRYVTITAIRLLPQADLIFHGNINTSMKAIVRQQAHATTGEGANVPPCVLALLVDVDRGGGGQFPIGHSRMQHPVGAVASSPSLGAARPLTLLRRLRRHQPHRSRSSSPELSHPSNCPSSGGATPMAYLHFNRTSRWSHSLHSEPPAVPEHQIGLRRPTPPASTNTARPAPPSKEHHRIASKNPTSLRRANAKIQPFRRIGPNQTGLRGPAARSRRIVSVSRRRKWHGSVKKTPPPHATAGQWHGVVEQEEALSLSCQGAGSSRRQWRRRGEGGSGE